MIFQNSAFIVFTITCLLSVSKCTLTFNKNDIMEIYSQSYSLMEKKLNFSDGTWYVIKNGHDFDGRILEFHSNRSFFVNFYKNFGQKLDVQNFLFSGIRALTFYKGQKPIIQQSILREEGVVVSSSLSEVEDFLRGLADEDLSFLNWFPVYKMDHFYYYGVNHLLSFQNRLEMSLMISESYSKEPKFKNFPMAGDEFRIFLEKTLSLAVDYAVLGDPDLLEKHHYPQVQTQKLQEIAEAKSKFIENKVALTFPSSSTGKLRHLLEEYFSSLTYLSLKASMSYFFKLTSSFLKDLFRDVSVEPLNWSNLFQKNILEQNLLNVLNEQNLENLEIKGYIDNMDMMSRLGDDQVKPFEKKYFLAKKKNLHKQFLVIVDELKPSLQETFNIDQFPEAEARGLDSLLFFQLKLWRESYFPRIFSQFAEYIKNSISKSINLQDIGVSDLSKSENLLLIRRYFMILGFVDFDLKLDLPFVDYKPMEIFQIYKGLLI